ncbi:MAG: Immunogenic protein MPT70 [Alphaproteobacteria bacterium MarineAlpha11_Bin1]|nr:MAG: Immunogenic protein MPT70 [Alphaproteobacteria bacterium MarineAlpha11_Bin1]
MFSIKRVFLLFAIVTLFPFAVSAGHHQTKKDIVEVAGENGSFNTLVAAVKAAGLVGVLKSKGPFTVFAPTDEAFAKLPPGTVSDLLKPENREKLSAILKHHVLSSAVPSRAIIGKRLSPKTVNGTYLHIDASKGVVVSGAKVIAADVKASNGIIHVINKVLLP